MNLIDRIDRALADETWHVHPDIFEKCATSLLTQIYTNLTPVSGGADFGVDGEICSDEALRTVLVVTSSRSWDGVRKNLQGSLASMQRNMVPVGRVITANLAELNQSKREKLRKLAADVGVEIQQFYDRTWFANALRQNPDWRVSLLGIDGRPVSLSRFPTNSSPGDQEACTVGREKLLEQLERLQRDVILYGVPGVGKSHVASRLEEGFFLESSPPLECLLDDLISVHPKVVIIDDAKSRSEEIKNLLYLRHREKLPFRIVAICWPGEQTEILDVLANAEQIEVEKLDVQQIGEVLKSRGIKRQVELANYIGQAAGRPGWAVNLATLSRMDDSRKSAWFGDALREKLFSSLQQKDDSKKAVLVLALIALLGEVDEDDFGKLSEILGMGTTDLRQVIRSIAMAGLVDVQETVNYDWGTKNELVLRRLRVRPESVATSIVRHAFFSDAFPAVSIEDVKRIFPSHLPYILRHQINAKLRGAPTSTTPPLEEVMRVANSIIRNSLLIQFSKLNRSSFLSVLGILSGQLTEALLVEDISTANKLAQEMGSVTVASFEVGDPLAIESLFAELSGVDLTRINLQKVFEEMVRTVRTPVMGDLPCFEALVQLVDQVRDCKCSRRTERAWATLMVEMLTPSFENSYMDPSSVDTIIIQPYCWSPQQIDKLANVALPDIQTRVSDLDRDSLQHLLKLLSKWVRVGSGLSLGYGLEPTVGQAKRAENVANQLGDILAPAMRTGGLRAQFNKVCAQLGKTLEEEDPLFKALVMTRPLKTDFKKWCAQQTQTIDRALMPYIAEQPECLMEWLSRQEPELLLAGHGSDRISRVFDRVAVLDPQRSVEWLRAAVDNGFLNKSAPLVKNIVADQGLPDDLFERIMSDHSGRHMLISVALCCPERKEPVQDVLRSLTDQDLLHPSIISGRDIGLGEAWVRDALFVHKDKAVRGLAAAMWAAGEACGERFDPGDAHWRSAIQDFEMPVGSNELYWISEALEVIAERAPELFSNLFYQQFSKEGRTTNGRSNFDHWYNGMRCLSRSEREELWWKVKDLDAAAELFWVISCNEVQWIATVVAEEGFSIPLQSLLLSTEFQFGKRFPLEDLVRMFRSISSDPDELLSTLDIGVFTGNESSVYAEIVSDLRVLVDSEDQYLAKTAQRGVRRFEEKLEKAKAKERQAALRGHYA
ncbi:ATP-binding protein [Corynebacterium imitans]|uniref:ATP-binding protein n=1 Tax=Corynebacterium imitans TaxID=156978 RepID=UPI001EF1D640|nr:ATP-binding protein [Corynebacterium imitans]MCG7277892.1 ATP-binding protein [Corynebacterium imitans]